MIVSDADSANGREGWPKSRKAETQEGPEPLGRHLLRIASVAFWAIAPFAAVLLMLGHAPLAFGIAGGGLVSLIVFGSLRVMIYRLISGLSAGADPPGPLAMAQFAFASLIKFLVMAAVVYGLVRLHTNLIALLSGFVIAQVAISIAVARSKAR